MSRVGAALDVRDLPLPRLIKINKIKIIKIKIKIVCRAGAALDVRDLPLRRGQTRKDSDRLGQTRTDSNGLGGTGAREEGEEGGRPGGECAGNVPGASYGARARHPPRRGPLSRPPRARGRPP